MSEGSKVMLISDFYIILSTLYYKSSNKVVF